MRIRARGAAQRRTAGVGVTLAGALAALLSMAATADAGAAADPHAAHRAAVSAAGPLRSIAHYRIPDVELTRDDGQVVGLDRELDDGRPVVLAFIYTSCASICPLTSQTLEGIQRRLGPERDRVHLVSVSIDPDADTPARLREYAQNFHAGPEWQHYTGTRAASEAVQRAFSVYRGDKMSHPAAIFVRAAAGAAWIRMDGFPTADQVFAELPQAHAAR